VFEPALVQRYLAGLVAGAGLDWDEFLALGHAGDDEQFGLTPLALRLSGRANGVSELHGEVAREMWRELDVPIGSVTNGVHARTWLAAELQQQREPTDEELWRIHLQCKRELVDVARARGVSLADGANVLTIGFARRFATYKRAGLLFTDLDRLAKLLWDEKRPIQVVFAGKAHPADRPGQRVIQDIFTRSRAEPLRGRVYILEDYDIRIARYLVAGVDVWLNNPRRPLEASGTSGMKAATNGVVNCSVLDGWWDEGWTGDNGWAIGGREMNADEGAQDWSDAQDLYRLLEEEIVPRYYEHDAAGLPAAWVDLMRRSMASTLWRFSTTRMLHDYLEKMYLPAAASARKAAAAQATKADRKRAASQAALVAHQGG